MQISRRFWAVSVVLCLTGACGSEPTPTAESSSRFVGRITGTNAYFGMVSNSTRAVVYVCDGTESSASLAVWFDGSVSAGAVALQSGTARWSARLVSNTLTGTFTGADGVAHPIEAAAAGDSAGLYRDDRTRAGLLGGWIILDDASARGAGLRAGMQILTSTNPVLSPRDPASIVSPRDPASIVSPRILSAVVDGVTLTGTQLLAANP